MDSTPELPRPVASVGLVTLCGDHVLLVRRDKEPYRGKWSFPGGSIEPGETSREAARREALEETSIAVEVVDVADVLDSIHPPAEGRPSYHYVIIDFLAVPAGATRTCPVPLSGRPELRAATDVSDARWVPLNELERYELTPLARPVLERALRRYTAWLREEAALECGGLPPLSSMPDDQPPAESR
jgi:ADP-ribose pyrophosphatase YjhB (NUDIX family)